MAKAVGKNKIRQNVSTKEITERALKLYLRRRYRIRIASFLEIYAYMGALIALFYRQYRFSADIRMTDIDAVFGAITSPVVLIGLALLFFGTFSLLLSGVTPVVRILSREPDISIPQSPDLPSPPPPEVPLRITQSIQRQRETGAHQRDEVDNDFVTYIDRSQNAAQTAQGRPNALLFVGTLIAVFGLVFFVVTLPDGKFGLFDAPSVNGDAISKVDFWTTAVQVLPRLLMLLFIQVLAGFFLRQYRSAMEDFRYYESVLRHREAQYVSYKLRKRLNDKKALLNFADTLLNEREFGRISKGQSTTILEAQRAEANEFTSVYEKLASLYSKVGRRK